MYGGSWCIPSQLYSHSVIFLCIEGAGHRRTRSRTNHLFGAFTQSIQRQLVSDKNSDKTHRASGIQPQGRFFSEILKPFTTN
jgi:hypothetical protein